MPVSNIYNLSLIEFPLYHSLSPLTLSLSHRLSFPPWQSFVQIREEERKKEKKPQPLNGVEYIERKRDAVIYVHFINKIDRGKIA